MENANRRVFLGVCAAGAAAAGAGLAGCASAGATPSAGGAASGAPAGNGNAQSGTVVAQTTDIPVGGGTIVPDAKVVITQPTAGTFKAFSAVCTHRGCTVAQVSGGLIKCPCHGSEFSAVDGSVAHGPATSPLPPVKVRVQGIEITLAS